MRAELSQQKLTHLFYKAQKKAGSLKNLAERYSVSVRTISDWKSGKFSLPTETFRNLASLTGLSIKDLHPIFLDDTWSKKMAGRIGGRARIGLYGSPGTRDGRRKGGLRSIATHAQRSSKFKSLKSVTVPKLDKKLAEFMGILLGDGHLAKYQVSLSTHSETDAHHATLVQSLFEQLFKVSATLKKKKGKNVITIVASSRRLVLLLEKLGMPVGNKIHHGLTVPNWVKKNKELQEAFLRGLFDTDGCIYLDRHIIRGRTYANLGWTITSYADTLIAGILALLLNLGFSPTYRSSQKSVYLRRRNDIERYFREIGTSNPKHRERYRLFIGRVPKRS